MNKMETIDILELISVGYPNFKPQSMEKSVKLWSLLFEDYEYTVVQAALKTYMTTNTSGFAPAPSQLIDIIHNLIAKTSGDEMTGAEAWSLVLKAIGRGSYHSQEDFDSFPEDVKKAIGSASIIKELAMDTSFNEGVEKSHFIKVYDRVVADRKAVERMPVEIRNLIGGKTNGNDRIGNRQELLIGEGQEGSTSNPCRP